MWHHIATGSSLIWPNLSERLGKMIAPVEGAVALQCTYDMPNLSRGEGKGQFLGRPANLGRGTWEIWPRASPVLVLGPWAIFIALKLRNLSPQLWPHMSNEILRCKLQQSPLKHSYMNNTERNSKIRKRGGNGLTGKPDLWKSLLYYEGLWFLRHYTDRW